MAGPGGFDSLRDIVKIDGPTGAPVFFEVSRADGKLFAELTGLGSYPRMELYAASADSFFTINDLPVAFTRDGSGRAQRVRMGQIEGHRR